jgi:tRNA A-37 threonylcarbamoyl transferase component Bud32
MRAITTMGNLHYYKNVSVPKLFNMLEKRFKIRFHATDAKNLYDAIDQLDNIVFYNYIRKQAAKMHEITQNGTF